MRVLSLSPNPQRNQPQRRDTRASHLRLVTSARPANASNGRLLQFHFHGDPRPAA